jgi:hypothetical protein
MSRTFRSVKSQQGVAASTTLQIIDANEPVLSLTKNKTGSFSTWTNIGLTHTMASGSIVWAKELGLFVCMGQNTTYGTSSDGISWVARTFPTTINRSGKVEWSPQLGLLVASSYYSVTNTSGLWYSADGISWTQASSSFGTGYYSAESIRWVPHLSMFIGTFSFLATDSSAATRSITLSSRNGTTWSLISDLDNTVSYMYDVAYSPTLRMLVQLGAGSTQLRTSSDGITWSNVASASLATVLRWYCVIWCPEMELFMASGSSGYIAYSYDGTSWTVVNTGIGSVHPLFTLIWIPELNAFVIFSAAVGAVNAHRGIVAYRNNLASWTQFTASSTSASNTTAAAWSPELSRIVIGYSASNGLRYLTIKSAIDVAAANMNPHMVLTQGTTETTTATVDRLLVKDTLLVNDVVSRKDSITRLHGSAYLHDTLYLTKSTYMEGNVNVMSLTKNKTGSLNTWSPTSGSPEMANMLWVPEKAFFISMGIYTPPPPYTGYSSSPTYIYISSDGITWSSSSFPTPVQWYAAIAWSPQLGLFVATVYSFTGGNTSSFWYSSDGVNWTQSYTVTGCYRYRALQWVPHLGLFIVSVVFTPNAPSSTSYVDRVLISRNGKAWTQTEEIGSTTSLRGIAWSPTLKLLVQIVITSNRIRTSTDGITWTPSADSALTGAVWDRVIWAPAAGLFFTGSTAGDVAYSANGTSWTLVPTKPMGTKPIGDLIYVPEHAALFIFTSDTTGEGAVAYLNDFTAWTTFSTIPSGGSGTYDVTSSAWSRTLNRLVVGSASGNSARYLTIKSAVEIAAGSMPPHTTLTQGTVEMRDVNAVRADISDTLIIKDLMSRKSGITRLHGPAYLYDTLFLNTGTATTTALAFANMSIIQSGSGTNETVALQQNGSNHTVFDTTSSSNTVKFHNKAGTQWLLLTDIDADTAGPAVSLSSTGTVRCGYLLGDATGGLALQVPNNASTAPVSRMMITNSAITANVSVNLINGTVAAPSLTFTGDTSQNSGLYLIGNDNIGLSRTVSCAAIGTTPAWRSVLHCI